MPEISRFFGMVIAMFYNDHAPPHFHVRYGEQRAIVGIDSASLISGSLSPRVLGLVVEWTTLHRSELLDNWNRARRMDPLADIAPLE